MENQNSFFDGLPSVKSVIKMGCLLSLFRQQAPSCDRREPFGFVVQPKAADFLVRRLFVLGGDDEDSEREQDQTDNESDHAAAGDAADKEADDALAHIDKVNAFLKQGLGEKSTFEQTLEGLFEAVR